MISTPFYDYILVSLIRAMQATKVVELGTYEGVSTGLFAAALEGLGGHIWSVDDNRDNGIAAATKILATRDNVTLVSADSGTSSWYLGSDIDLVFADADHTYDGVAREWKAWSPKVKPGGVYAIHDTAPGGDPATFVSRTFPSHGWEGMTFPWSNGLFIARRLDV